MSEYHHTEDETFLYYAEPTDIWVCPSCETELKMSEESCFLCGCTKQAWYRFQANEQRKLEYERSIHTTAATQNSSRSGLRTLIIVLVIIALFILFYYAANAAEIETIVTETEECISVM